MSEWIRASERLPERYEPVLVTCGEAVAIAQLDCFSVAWAMLYNKAGIRSGEVTHWQPMPTPPGADDD